MLSCYAVHTIYYLDWWSEGHLRWINTLLWCNNRFVGWLIVLPVAGYQILSSTVEAATFMCRWHPFGTHILGSPLFRSKPRTVLTLEPPNVSALGNHSVITWSQIYPMFASVTATHSEADSVFNYCIINRSSVWISFYKLGKMKPALFPSKSFTLQLIFFFLVIISSRQHFRNEENLLGTLRTKR